MISKYCLPLAAAALLAVASPSFAEPGHMAAALTSLEHAQASLEKADNDKGGHRGPAMKAISQAIKEVKAGIEYDKTHKSGEEKPNAKNQPADAKAKPKN